MDTNLYLRESAADSCTVLMGSRAIASDVSWSRRGDEATRGRPANVFGDLTEIGEDEELPGMMRLRPDGGLVE